MKAHPGLERFSSTPPGKQCAGLDFTYGAGACPDRNLTSLSADIFRPRVAICLLLVSCLLSEEKRNHLRHFPAMKRAVNIFFHCCHVLRLVVSRENVYFRLSMIQSS